MSTYAWSDVGKPCNTEIRMARAAVEPESSEMRVRGITTAPPRSVLGIVEQQGRISLVDSTVRRGRVPAKGGGNYHLLAGWLAGWLVSRRLFAQRMGLACSAQPQNRRKKQSETARTTLEGIALAITRQQSEVIYRQRLGTSFTDHRHVKITPKGNVPNSYVLTPASPAFELHPRGSVKFEVRVKAVHDKESTLEMNIRKMSLPLHEYILMGVLSDIRPRQHCTQTSIALLCYPGTDIPVLVIGKVAGRVREKWQAIYQFPSYLTRRCIKGLGMDPGGGGGVRYGKMAPGPRRHFRNVIDAVLRMLQCWSLSYERPARDFNLQCSCEWLNSPLHVTTPFANQLPVTVWSACSPPSREPFAACSKQSDTTPKATATYSQSEHGTPTSKQPPRHYTFVFLSTPMEQRENERAGKREIPEKTRRPAASSGTIPTCENPGVARSGIEPDGIRAQVGKSRIFLRTPVQSLVLNVDGARNTRGSVALTAPRFSASNAGRLAPQRRYLALQSVLEVWAVHGSFQECSLYREQLLREFSEFIQQQFRLLSPITWFDFRPVRFRIFGIPFPPPFHSGAAPYATRFTLIGSHDIDVKSRPNIFTHSRLTCCVIYEIMIGAVQFQNRRIEQEGVKVDSWVGGGYFRPPRRAARDARSSGGDDHWGRRGVPSPARPPSTTSSHRAALPPHRLDC
ncbi:hypothetical protein PR048_006319 [Dryococelus australis]|uniref:Uncharacterized protein n=1 Tax=Dryococelus australis TaxID=614101 RepID=A0ABQ9IAN3_9NEOP|nr:hypothetical protein PR048_006319 [Dryococelus australis]